MSDDILYTPEEIASKLKISKYTVYEMIKRGDITAYKIGRNIRISSSQLESYMSSVTRLDNIYNAIIVKENIETCALVGSVKIFVSTALSGNVKISIQPEDIILSKTITSSSALNVLKGIVTDIIIEENSVKVFVDVGIEIISLITKKSLKNLNIQKNDELYVVFKAMAVRVFK